VGTKKTFWKESFVRQTLQGVRENTEDGDHAAWRLGVDEKEIKRRVKGGKREHHQM
jgi:hypothetical protein